MHPLLKPIKALDKEQAEHIIKKVCVYHNLMAELKAKVAQAKGEAAEADAESLLTMTKEQERQFALTWVELFAPDLEHVGLRSGDYKPKVKGVSASGIFVTFTDALMKKVALLSKLITSPTFSPGFRAELM